MNQGQVCLCGSRIFISNKIWDVFIEKFINYVEDMKIGDPSLEDSDLGSLVSFAHRDKVESYIHLAQREGGKILSGGGSPNLSSPFDKGAFLEPTVVSNLSHMSRTATEEIFGPVVNIFEFDDIDEAIGIANHNEFAFQSSVFTNNLNKAMYCYEKLIAKTVLINEQTTFRVDWMPFGGIRHSGEGVGGISYSYSDMVYNKVLIIDTLI